MDDAVHDSTGAANRGTNKLKPSVSLSDREMESLVRTCFGGLLSADHTLTPSFVVGDFDGDGTQDLFVPVRLGRSVNRKNRSRTPFNYQEVLDPASPASVALNLRMGDLAIVENWPLFVVVHGLSKARMTRCSESRYKFLLLFAMNKGTTSIKLFNGKKLPRGTINDPKEDQPPPRLKGEAILLLDPDGEGSAIYWDGARYRWYPVNRLRK